MPDIRIDKVTFTYAGVAEPVLRSLNLTIAEGEFVLLTGPSGCGKSTLALALAGLIPSRVAGHMRGSVYYGADNISTMEVHEVAQHIGIVFQNPDNQLVQQTVEEEVAFGPENLALPHAEIEQRVQQALSYTGMESMRGEQIYALSGGQKQRIAISATLAMRPGMLVLDEPTSDLDPLGTQEVLNVLRTLNKQYGMTIVLIEHKVDAVVSWVDRVLLMEAGRIIVDSSPRKAFYDLAPWDRLGVAVPEMVMLANALPEVFRDTLPVCVDEALASLRGTPYVRRLLQQGARELTVRPSSPAQSIVGWDAIDLVYGQKQVLYDVHLNIFPNEWVAMIGPNGSGKTSLASLAMGFQAPTRGTVRFRGRAIKPGSIFRQAENTAYLFQAADNMLFGSTVEKEFLFGVKRRRGEQVDVEIKARMDQLLKMADLTHELHTNPFHLSHGQRKRLAIAVLLMRYPEVLILDEPTTGQDEGHARAFLQFLQMLHETGKFTYVMITHHMQTVAHYANRVVVLKDGRIFMDGKPDEIFARRNDLALCGILPPPISELHARLCEDRVSRVALTVPDFLRLLHSVEEVPS